MIHKLLDSLEYQRSEEEVSDTFLGVTRRLGFDYYCYAFVSNFPAHRPTIAVHHNYPAVCLGPREEVAYLVATDPGVRHGLRSHEPFVWSDHWSFADADGDGDGDGDAGLKFGWTQSSVDGFGAVGILTLSRSGVHITPQELDEKEPYMRRLVRAGHTAMAGFIRAREALPLEALTFREIQVLQWSAAGKTCPQICELLDIGASTVSFHVKNAAKKLGVKNKTSAVAHALVLGLLNQPLNCEYL